MLYLTLIQNSGGRSGHKLKDIITVFILSYFIKGLVLVRHFSWNKQAILSHFNYRWMKSLKYDETHELKMDNWGGMSDTKFFDTIEYIKHLDRDNKKILIVLSGAYRYMPCQLHNLYLNNKIEKDYFTNDFLNLIKRLYFGKNIPIETNNCVAIHVRRGDIAKRLIEKGQNSNYYKNIIRKLNKYLNIPIRVYSESLDSRDLRILKDEPNVSLHLGNTDSLKKDFYEIVTSKYLIISTGGFSTISAYISIGTVLYNSNFCWHFGHKEPPNNMYNFKLNSLPKLLKNIANDP